jgi:integrase
MTIVCLYMASIHKDPRGKSPFWFAAFTGGDGRRMFRSTKETNRAIAQKVCFKWAEAAEKARRKELSAAASRKLLGELTLISSGEQLEFHSVEGWLEGWLASKAGSTAKATYAKYSQVVGSFLSHLGSRAGACLASVSPTDVSAFRDKLAAEGRSPKTVNLAKSVLNIPFEIARRRGMIPFNPVAAVDSLRTSRADGPSGKEAFSDAELAALVSAADGDWRGAILLGATSGLRLGDIAGLRWESVELDGRFLRVVTGKTGKVVVVPMHANFLDWLALRERGIGRAFVFPDLAGNRLSGTGGLSVQFTEIVKKAGVAMRVTERKGKGRTTRGKTFHSLRHSFISALANSGVAPDIRQKLAGHADPRVHAGYTHHEIETLRGAISKLPVLKAEGEETRYPK